MSAESLLSAANAAFVNEDFEGAAKLYDEAVAASKGAPSPQLLIARAANAIKRKEYQSALNDTDAAIRSDSQSNLAYYRRGTALFYLDRFTDAKQAFLRALELGNKSSELMLRKCEAEISRQSKSGAVAAVPVAAAATTPSAVPMASKVTEQWFQSQSQVTITLFVRNLTANAFEVQLTETNQVSAKLTMPDGSVFQQQWRLFAPVSAVKTDLTAYKLEIILTKSEATEWAGLVEEEKKKIEGVVKRENILRDDMAKSQYPTSAKKKIEWSELEQTAKKLEDEEKPTGDAALQKLFQTIYKDADEDTRRAMVKSFQTSGGTVLSTNWKEVGNTDYTKDRKAPDGQEFKDWSKP